jgi:hypothetical protein
LRVANRIMRKTVQFLLDGPITVTDDAHRQVSGCLRVTKVTTPPGMCIAFLLHTAMTK